MKLLIAIHGAHCRQEAMQAQRETWLSDLEGADYRFFLGEPVCKSKDEVYGAFPDGPTWDLYGRTWVLNRKTETLVLYALRHRYDFVFKCDDDTYVRTELLLKSGFEQFDYVGATERGGIFAVGGSGYWLSRRAMEIIGWNGLKLHNAEDICVGMVLAQHGINVHNDGRYVPQVGPLELEYRDARKDSITLHKVNSQWMRKLHASYRGQA